MSDVEEDTPLIPIKTNNISKIDDKNIKKKDNSVKLIVYNLLSGCLWSFALLNVIATKFVFKDPQILFELTSRWTTIIQCLAIVEIYNSAMGIVRSPLMTTTMQVSSRLLVVLGIWTFLPNSSGNFSYAYLTVHFAWCITEVIRYYYYAINLLSQQPDNETKVPLYLEWLRYNAFLILYPIGISSECYMIYSAIGNCYTKSGLLYAIYALFLYFVLLLYIPGSFILYSHMLKQRAKFNGAQQKHSKKKD